MICVFGKQKSKAGLSAGKPPGMLVSEAGLLPLGGGGREQQESAHLTITPRDLITTLG